MPRYDYRCRACDITFELNRPMSAANDPATCPQGHGDTTKLLSTVAVTGTASTPAPPATPEAAAAEAAAATDPTQAQPTPTGAPISPAGA